MEEREGRPLCAVTRAFSKDSVTRRFISFRCLRVRDTLHPYILTYPRKGNLLALCTTELRLLLLLGLLLLDLLENDDGWCPEGHGLAPDVGLAAILVEIPILNRHGLLAPDN